MPLYDYKCQTCGSIHEHYTKSLDTAPTVLECDACPDGIMLRQLSRPAIVYNSPDNSVFLGGNLTKMDTLNGRRKSTARN
jgi:putative FmdB family regulatory protein